MQHASIRTYHTHENNCKRSRRPGLRCLLCIWLGLSQYVEAIGASFVPVEGYGDFHDLRARDLDPDCYAFLVDLLPLLEPTQN